MIENFPASSDSKYQVQTQPFPIVQRTTYFITNHNQANEKKYI